MNQLINLTGQKFGLLTVLDQAPSKYTEEKTITMWRVVCECGQVKSAASNQLRKKEVKTCGSKECRAKYRGSK